MGWGVNDYPDAPPETPAPICPFCGQEAETFVADKDGEVFACENCYEWVDAWEWRQNNV